MERQKGQTMPSTLADVTVTTADRSAGERRRKMTTSVVSRAGKPILSELEGVTPLDGHTSTPCPKKKIGFLSLLLCTVQFNCD